MPDFDSGHIFLTTLAPIRDSRELGQKESSFVQDIRIALAKMPTALQSPATIKMKAQSPFAKIKRTHLARMFVINDAIYNGRIGKNALAAAITRDDPAVIQEVDRLNTAYLVFCADIDAVEENGKPLPKTLTPTQQRRVRDSYARELWDKMGDELRDIYKNCVGFERVKTAQDFADYLDKCHVETTMPFHDYYLKLPAFSNLPLKWMIPALAAPALWTVVSLLLLIFGVPEMPFGPAIGTFSSFLLGLVVTGAVGFGLVKYANQNGNKPLPPAEYDDLPTVLKALYTQQKFTDFAIDAQGASPQDLHDRFGQFLTDHDPANREGPTQEPGVINSPQA